MKFRPGLFLKELFLFGSTILIGIFSAYSYRPLIEKSVVEPQFSSWDDIVIFLAILAIISVIILKFRKVGGFFLRFFLLLVVFSGSQIIYGSVVSSPWDLALAIATVLLFMFVKNVFIHDVGLVLGLAGISSVLGITISPKTAVFLMVILSFYDIIAVYWTKHMVYLAKGMMESGAIFGFIIPFKLADLFYHSSEAKKEVGGRFMVLGSGDIGLPVIMASSVAVVSISQALVVGFFSLLGLLATHLIFVNQSERKPMAALPPIATLTIIGYVVAQLI